MSFNEIKFRIEIPIWFVESFVFRAHVVFSIRSVGVYQADGIGFAKLGNASSQAFWRSRVVD